MSALCYATLLRLGHHFGHKYHSNKRPVEQEQIQSVGLLWPSHYKQIFKFQLLSVSRDRQLCVKVLCSLQSNISEKLQLN